MPETGVQRAERLRIAIAGNVVRAPRRSQGHPDRPQGRANFSVAVSWASGPFCRDRELPRFDEHPVAVVSAADDLAIRVLASLQVGDPVVVVGRLAQDGRAVLAREIGLSIRLVDDMPELVDDVPEAS